MSEAGLASPATATTSTPTEVPVTITAQRASAPTRCATRDAQVLPFPRELRECEASGDLARRVGRQSRYACHTCGTDLEQDSRRAATHALITGHLIVERLTHWWGTRDAWTALDEARSR